MNVECEPLRLVVTRRVDHLVVELIGELDLSCVEPLARVTDLDLTGVTGITVDLADLEFIDSTAIQALLAFKKTHEGSGREVRFVRPQPFVNRIFLVLGLGEYLTGQTPPIA